MFKFKNKITYLVLHTMGALNNYYFILGFIIILFFMFSLSFSNLSLVLLIGFLLWLIDSILNNTLLSKICKFFFVLLLVISTMLLIMLTLGDVCYAMDIDTVLANLKQELRTSESLL